MSSSPITSLGTLPSTNPSTKPKKPKSKWVTLLTDKSTSKIAVILDYFFLIFLILSVCCFCVETLPVVRTNEHLEITLFIVDSITIAIFTVEFILNCLAMDHWKEVLNWGYAIDIITILPFYLEILINLSRDSDVTGRAVAGGLGAIRVLRVFRAARLFKVFQRSYKLRSMIYALKDSFDGIIILVFAIMLLTVFYSTLIYYSEQTGSRWVNSQWVYDDGSLTPFQSIPGSFFLIVLSLTGNPPDYPRTILGQTVMVLAMVTYLMIVAFPLTILSLSYHRMAKKLNDRTARKKEIKKMKSRSKSFPLFGDQYNKPFGYTFGEDGFPGIPSTIEEEPEEENNDEDINFTKNLTNTRRRRPMSLSLSDKEKHSSVTGKAEATQNDVIISAISTFSLEMPSLPSANVSTITSSPFANQSETVLSNLESSSQTPLQTPTLSPPTTPPSQGTSTALKSRSQRYSLPEISSFVLRGENTNLGTMEAEIISKLGRKSSRSPKLGILKIGNATSTSIPSLQITNAPLTISPTTSNPSLSPFIPKKNNMKYLTVAGTPAVTQSGAFENLSYVNLHVVDWQYTLGQPKRDLTYESDESDNEMPGSNHHLDNSKGTKPPKLVGGDTLSIRLAIRNPEQLRRLLRTLSEFD